MIFSDILRRYSQNCIIYIFYIFFLDIFVFFYIIYSLRVNSFFYKIFGYNIIPIYSAVILLSFLFLSNLKYIITYCSLHAALFLPLCYCCRSSRVLHVLAAASFYAVPHWRTSILMSLPQCHCRLLFWEFWKATIRTAPSSTSSPYKIIYLTISVWNCFNSQGLQILQYSSTKISQENTL